MLTQQEAEFMKLCREPGGIDLFWQYWSAPEDGTQTQARTDLIGLAVDKWYPPLLEDEFVPLTPIYWAKDIVHKDFSDVFIIGGVGSGKTMNMVLIAGYYCCMLPNFRYLGTAPLSWQSELSYKEFVTLALDWFSERPRRIKRWIKALRSRPYPTVEFVNGSSMEFKSLDKDAAGILTWSGDMITADQVEDNSVDLERIISNLGSRLRGQVGGRARLGKMVLMANSAYKPDMWEEFDRYDSDPERLAMLLTSWDNPYLTEKQLRDIEKRYRNKEEADRMMRSARPLPKGKEFTEQLISNSQSVELDELMADGRTHSPGKYHIETSSNAGVVQWSLPYIVGHDYIEVCDPGQANPPYRNSPVVMAFDVTGFPDEPAKLAYFRWVYGHGSYIPFILAMQEVHEIYHPLVAAFDSTGTQKAFDELGILDPKKIWTPLDMGHKMHYVLCTKVLMGKGLIQIPKSLYSVWNQLLMWHMPDKQLRQDIASTLFMAGYLLNQLLPQSFSDMSEEVEASYPSRWEGRVTEYGGR